MNAKQIEVHEYFKAMHPEALILYHLPGQYMMLGEDVNRALKSIHQIKLEAEDVGTIPDNIYSCRHWVRTAAKSSSSSSETMKIFSICRM